MEYKELKAGISSHLNAAAEDFFMVGYFLRQISENALFTEDGYKNIWDFAKGEYGLSTSSASRFMAINARFSIDGGEHMAQKYIGMGVSKLQEMLSLPDEELEKVTKETTVREIRAMKAQATKPLSFYGFPATKHPEGSLLTTAGCGNGKHDCFDCCRDCAIRQEDRYCRTAPLGNPFPCKQMSEDFRKGIQYSLHKNECQHLHPELAPIRDGDKEPNPCCLTCDIKTCFLRCDVAKKKDEQERKEREVEERRKEREAEAARPEPSGTDIKAFYEWAHFKLSDNITADGLKKEYRAAGGGGGLHLKNFQGSSRGVRINYKRELTYAQLAKALNEYQEGLRKVAEAEVEAEPDIIDADFREVTDEPTPAAMTDKEKRELLKEKEPELIAAFYKELYPGQKETVKQRKAADITKMLKKEYGETYEGGRDENGLLWNCYPDKISLSISGLCLPLQITWGKFTTKLLALLEEQPGLETEPAAEPELDEDLQQAEEPEETQEQEAEIVEEPEEAEEPTEDPEAYRLFDVWRLLSDQEKAVRDYREAGMPEDITRKQVITRDALRLLYETMKEREEAAADED